MTAHTGNGSASASPTFGDRLTRGGRAARVPDRPRHRPRSGAAVARRGRGHERGAGAARDHALRGRARRRRRPRVGERTRAPRASSRGSRPPRRCSPTACALIDAAAPACVAVKPQLACFERLGAPGWLALEHVCAHARERGLLVLADGKRGDVPVTAKAYAQALVSSTPSPFGSVDGLRADAFTANPLLGRDALEPLIETARAHGAGAFVLVRTSNPGAADLLDARLATGERLWERLATLVADLGRTGRSGPRRRRRRHRRDRAPAPRPPARADARTPPSCSRASAPRAATSPRSPRRSRRAAPAGSSPRRARSPTPTSPRTQPPPEAARAEAERLREQAWALS